LRNTQDAIIGVLGIYTDVTEERQVREELKLSRERLGYALQGANDGLWDWNLEDDSAYYSPRWLEMLGYAPGELPETVEAWSGLVHADDQPRATHALAAYLEGHAPRYQAEFRMLHKDGHWVDILSRAILAQDAAGQPVQPRRLIGTHMDISDRMQAEERLRESAFFLKETQRIGQVGGWRADPVRNTVMWTEGVYAILEIPLDYQPDLETALDFYPPGSREQVVDALRKTLDTGLPFTIQIAVRSSRGRHSWCELRGFPHRDSQGAIDYVMGTLQDISERKHAEQALRQLNAELEDRVRERTGQLESTTQALMLARDAAERASRAKSEFVANMSHEIRTPLNGVLGMAQVGYRDSQGQPRLHDTFGKILSSGKLLLGIINDILDFSKIEAGRLKIERVPVSLVEVIRECVSLMQERASAKKLVLRVKKAPDLPPACLSDPLRLGQVLMNLLSNAVKFTEEGSVTLSAALEGGDLVFKVIDTGIGMTREQAEKAFRPFEQADGSTTRKFGGTGLGLTITRRLVELMGGSLAVESTPGQGSVFEARLPYIPAVSPRAAPNGRTQAPHRALAGLKVLVVEDNLVNQAVLESALKDEGAEVVVANNGQEAVDCVAQSGAAAFDTVLMDIQMPVMNGHEATQRILELAPGLPVIGQTAHAFAEERQACFDSGMVEHLAKPIAQDDLVAAILRHLPARPEPEAPHPAEG
jgi:PAS domain S-box-containing protein